MKEKVMQVVKDYFSPIVWCWNKIKALIGIVIKTLKGEV